MKAPSSIRSAILLLGLPALWVGSYSISGQAQAPDLEFVPVAVHAFHSADYSVDEFEKLAPVNEDIIADVQQDAGLSPPPSTTAPAPTATPTPEKDEDEDESGGGTQATPPPTSDNNGNNNGNGNGNENGNGNGNGNGGGNGGGRPTKTPKAPK
jgi:hypothetical protein